MQKAVVIAALTLFLTGISGFDRGISEAESNYRIVPNKAFQAGEKTRYLVHYGLIDAGYASIDITDFGKKLQGRDILKIEGKGRSKGFLDVFFHVDDTYETYVDKQSMFPWLFIRDVSEGGYEIQQTYKFYQDKNLVETKEGEKYEVPPHVQDMFSAAFYCRTMDLTDLEVGDIISIKSFVDEELFDLAIQYGGTEVINVRKGKFRCMKFNPVIQAGRIFNTAEDMEVWVTDDENKLPILCKAKILVGSVKIELVEWSGLANPLAKVD